MPRPGTRRRFGWSPMEGNAILTRLTRVLSFGNLNDMPLDRSATHATSIPESEPSFSFLHVIHPVPACRGSFREKLRLSSRFVVIQTEKGSRGAARGPSAFKAPYQNFGERREAAVPL